MERSAKRKEVCGGVFVVVVVVCVATVQGQADGIKFAEAWECLTCFYSQGRVSWHATSLVSITSRESQLPYILSANKVGRVPRYCVTKRDSVHAGPLSRLWEYCLSAGEGA